MLQGQTPFLERLRKANQRRLECSRYWRNSNDLGDSQQSDAWYKGNLTGCPQPDNKPRFPLPPVCLEPSGSSKCPLCFRLVETDKEDLHEYMNSQLFRTKDQYPHEILWRSAKMLLLDVNRVIPLRQDPPYPRSSALHVSCPSVKGCGVVLILGGVTFTAVCMVIVISSRSLA